MNLVIVRLPSILFFFLFVQSSFSSHANIQRQKFLISENHLSQDSLQDTPTPTTFFQVTKPIQVPNTKPCSSLILQHDFGYTFEQPPVTAPYNPPLNCPTDNFSKIVLEWRATCKGRQFDRIFGIWIDGVEILRSCTAEPRATGILWIVEKDITRYSSLLKEPRLVSVYLGNLVDKTYTGVYHVNLTIHFYPSIESHDVRNEDIMNFRDGFHSPADLILPISRNLPLNDGLWFLIKNSSDFQMKEFEIPRNSYRAVLEVYVSFHSDDEFWYSNPPNVYTSANNLTTPGNGAFREVIVVLDGQIVGAVWPFTVIYTGGYNPLLWRPITGIGSFDLPSYDIEITPFLGKILDGKKHTFAFRVTNALNVWFIDANLHIWLDKKSVKNKGKLISYRAPPFTPSLISNFKDLDGFFITNASRTIFSEGWVKTSYGKVTIRSFQEFDYKNWIEFGNEGDLQIVNQTIKINLGVYANLLGSELYSFHVNKKFPLFLYTDAVDQGNKSYSLITNISLGFDEERFSGKPFTYSFSSLKNLQKGEGHINIKDNLVTSGLGSTEQVYRYDSNESCYFRKVGASNYTILYDELHDFCDRKSRLSSDMLLLRLVSLRGRFV